MSRNSMELDMIVIDCKGPVMDSLTTEWRNDHRSLRGVSGRKCGGDDHIRRPGTRSGAKSRARIAKQISQSVEERGVITMCVKIFCLISTTYRGGHYEST